MQRKSTIFAFLSLLVLFLANPVLAQYTREKAALEKIGEAINQHYLATEFDKAEAVLTGTIVACEDKCSPATLAKAWMYVGVVRGSGKQDIQGATEAFAKALSLDGNVALDESLATPEVKEAFLSAGGAATSAEPASKEPEAKPLAEAEGTLICSPEVREIQTRRAIPMVCSTDENAARMEIRYREVGGKWKTANMSKQGDEFRGTIPCAATKLSGEMQVYVRALDAGDDLVDSLGTKSKPLIFAVAANVEAEPPSFPGEEPPARCAEDIECPPDFPGCGTDAPAADQQCGDKDWGASCAGSLECKCGLLCIDGACETAPSCTSDSDCRVGVCQNGACAVLSESEPAGGYSKFSLGFHVAQDVTSIGGPDRCVALYQQAGADADGFSCFLAGTETPSPGESLQGDSTVPNTFVVATTRFLLSLDYAITSQVTIGTRIGYAIGGGPPAGKQEADTVSGIGAKPGNPFLPFHAEARATLWIRPLSADGFLPYLQLGGGLAQVDAKIIKKDVRDCTFFTDQNAFRACVQNERSDADFVNNMGKEFLDSEGDDLDVYKKLGQGFVGGGVGALYRITPNLGAQLNLGLMYMLPTSGLVIQPSLGGVYSF